MKNVGRFLASGLLLSLVSLFLRAVGVSFQTFLAARLGAAGIGRYHLLLSVFAPAVTLSTAGIHLAASRLVAEELGKEERGRPAAVLYRCLLCAFAAAALIGAGFFTLSDLLAERAVGDGAASTALKMLAVSLPFLSLSSAVNGYFTAVRRVTRTAAVQVLDQLFRVALAVLLLARRGAEDPFVLILTVVFVSVTADLLSCLLLLLLGRLDAARLSAGAVSDAGLTNRVLSVALPVSVSSFLRSALVSLEHLLIPRGLRKRGVSVEAAMASYGAVSGMAMPILFFPASFLYAFTGLLIPEFAEAGERGDAAGTVELADRVIRTVLLFSIGTAGILMAFAEELGTALYGSGEAGGYLRILAPLIPVMYLDSAVDAVLKGVGEQLYTMKVNVADALISVLLVWLLIPRIGLYGYIVVIFVSEIVNFTFSFSRMIAVTGADGALLRRAARPLLSVAGAVVTVRAALFLAAPFRSPAVSAAIGIPAAALLYGLLLLLTGAITLRPKKRPAAEAGRS